MYADDENSAQPGGAAMTCGLPQSWRTAISTSPGWVPLGRLRVTDGCPSVCWSQSLVMPTYEIGLVPVSVSESRSTLMAPTESVTGRALRVNVRLSARPSAPTRLESHTPSAVLEVVVVVMSARSASAPSLVVNVIPPLADRRHAAAVTTHVFSIPRVKGTVTDIGWPVGSTHRTPPNGVTGLTPEYELATATPRDAVASNVNV